MGVFDFVKNAGAKIFGKDNDRSDSAKPLGTHLREHGIDPSTIQFRFSGDTVVMEGTVPDQDTREKAVLIVGNVDGVERVDDRLRVGRAGADFSGVSATSTSTSTASTSAASTSTSGNGDWASKTYTVKSGDTLSGISKQVYGDAGKYQAIFEANKPMLKDPDKIYPGQVLRIPPAG
ncbi:MAG: peptidoglycan-binding protein LysM [Lysobacter sp.]|nr:peptidoglycan-binding protein LysM [Lysobacter sp.]